MWGDDANDDWDDDNAGDQNESDDDIWHTWELIFLDHTD